MVRRQAHVERRLPLRILRVDVDARLSHQVRQSDLLATKCGPDEGCCAGVVRLVNAEAFVAVKEHMQADGVVALRRHMQSCDAHRCRHEEVGPVSDQ